jgi:hypothetical protein
MTTIRGFKLRPVIPLDFIGSGRLGRVPEALKETQNVLSGQAQVQQLMHVLLAGVVEPRLTWNASEGMTPYDIIKRDTMLAFRLHLEIIMLSRPEFGGWLGPLKRWMARWTHYVALKGIQNGQ